MKYTHILNYVASQPWAILPSKMDELMAVLAYRAAGHVFTEDEIQARIGSGAAGVSAPSGSAIAVVPLRGVIAHRMGGMDESSGGMSAERFTRMIQAAVADPQIGTILLDVDSPGGTIPGLQEAADAVYQARDTKKFVAVANSKMASAAYWIASQAHEIVGIPSALEPSIGSIGVFVVHQDLSAALEKEGIKTTIISAGKHKTDGNPFQPLSDTRRAQLQGAVDETYGAFIKAVARGRGVSASDVRSGYGEGQAMSALSGPERRDD
jgi:signal peptide peptidase SppA